MSWDNRSERRRYYTRTRRAGGKVVREYIGGGEAGEKAAAEDEAARVKRAAEREEQRAELARMSARDELLEAYDAFVTATLHEVLETVGYHKHKGEWRKRRERK